MAGRPVAFRIILAAIRAGAARVVVPAALRSPDARRRPGRVADRPGRASSGSTPPTPSPTSRRCSLPAAALAPAPALGRAAARISRSRCWRSRRPASAPVLTADRAAAGTRCGRRWSPARPLGDDARRALPVRAPRPPGRRGWFVRVARRERRRRSRALPVARASAPPSTPAWTPPCIGVSPAGDARGGGPRHPAQRDHRGQRVVGLAAAAVMAHGDPIALVAGLVLYLAAVVLDHADGEVARLTLTESAIGEWLDIAVDTVVHTALVLALGMAAAAATGGGAAAGVVGGARAWWPARWSARCGRRPGRRPTAARVPRRPHLRDGFYAMLLVFIVAAARRRRSWLPGLMIVVAVGTPRLLARRALVLSRQARAGRAEDGPEPEVGEGVLQVREEPLHRVIEGSVTYSSVRLTRSSPSPSGVIACQSLSPLKRMSVPGSRGQRRARPARAPDRSCRAGRRAGSTSARRAPPAPCSGRPGSRRCRSGSRCGRRAPCRSRARRRAGRWAGTAAAGAPGDRCQERRGRPATGRGPGSSAPARRSV